MIIPGLKHEIYLEDEKHSKICIDAAVGFIAAHSFVK